ncbi:MAG: alpha/beta hydrolase family esterase [Solirubrobacteraceae bacterium]
MPARAAGRRSPLVVALHGGGASGRFMNGYSGLAAVGDRAGFVAVFPDATGPQRFWNLNATTAPDDVGFVEALLEHVATVACVDPARVYAVGVSNGGGLATRLGCELSERVAGIVVVAGGFGRLPQCHPERPVSVLEIHGSNDASVPYGGEPEDGRAGDVRRWLAGWARRDRCAAVGPRRRVAPRTVRIDWRGCAPRTALTHIQVLGGGHQWPGATPPDPGPPSTISAAQQAWAFLAPVRAPRASSPPAAPRPRRARTPRRAAPRAPGARPATRP